MDMGKWKFESVKKKRTLLKRTLITEENRQNYKKTSSAVTPRKTLCDELEAIKVIFFLSGRACMLQVLGVLKMLNQPR